MLESLKDQATSLSSLFPRDKCCNGYSSVADRAVLTGERVKEQGEGTALVQAWGDCPCPWWCPTWCPPSPRAGLQKLHVYRGSCKRGSFAKLPRDSSSWLTRGGLGSPLKVGSCQVRAPPGSGAMQGLMAGLLVPLGGRLCSNHTVGLYSLLNREFMGFNPAVWMSLNISWGRKIPPALALPNQVVQANSGDLLSHRSGCISKAGRDGSSIVLVWESGRTTVISVSVWGSLCVLCYPFCFSFVLWRLCGLVMRNFSKLFTEILFILHFPPPVSKTR